MKIRTSYKAAVVIAAAALSVGTLTACGDDTTDEPETTSAETTTAAEESESEEESSDSDDPRLAPAVCGTDADDGKNHEWPIGEAEHGPFNMEAFYFQPGMMMDDGGMMPAYHDSMAHLELDLKTNETGTDYGWAVDETPADMNITYTIEDMDGNVIVEGDFMEMNATDGSHYGTNIPKEAEDNGLVGSLDDPKEYKVIFHMAPPAHYDLHVDRRTGVKVREWFDPFDVEMTMLYTGEQLKCIEENPTDDEPEGIPGPNDPSRMHDAHAAHAKH